MDEKSKERLKWLAGVGLAASPYIGGAIVTAVVLKRIRGSRRRAQGPGNSGSDIGNEVGDEANVGDIDDPWGLSGKSFKAPKGDQEAADLPEPLPTILLDETLPVPPHELWLLVMGNSDFMKRVSKLKKNRDLRIGRWHLGKGDTAERKVSYVTPFKKQIVGPKEAKAIEVYESRVFPHQGFAVDVKVHTPEVPYGSSFHSHLQWDAVSVGEKQTRLRVSCEVAFTKPCLVKGIVKKASLEGMKESYELFRGLLLDHLKMQSGGPSSRGPGNGRRPAVPQLLLLLLLGASILLLFMAYRRYLTEEPSWADRTASHARSLLADAAALLRPRGAPVQACLQGMAQRAAHAVEGVL